MPSSELGFTGPSKDTMVDAWIARHAFYDDRLVNLPHYSSDDGAAMCMLVRAGLVARIRVANDGPNWDVKVANEYGSGDGRASGFSFAAAIAVIRYVRQSGRGFIP